MTVSELKNHVNQLHNTLAQVYQNNGSPTRGTGDRALVFDILQQYRSETVWLTNYAYLEGIRSFLRMIDNWYAWHYWIHGSLYQVACAEFINDLRTVTEIYDNQ
jgi:hypothetical protein